MATYTVEGEPRIGFRSDVKEIWDVTFSRGGQVLLTVTIHLPKADEFYNNIKSLSERRAIALVQLLGKSG